MAQWQRKLKLKDVWNDVDDGKMTVQELAGIVANRLEKLKDFGDEDVDFEKQDIVDEFKGLSEDPGADLNDFNNVMCSLYDWADIPLDNEWPGKKVCWVETF